MSFKIIKLGEACNLQNGFAFKSKFFTEDGLPILRISNIQNQIINIKKIVYFKLEKYKEKLDKYIVEHNDLLIAMSGATTGKIGFNNTDQRFYLNQRVGNLKPKEILDKKYLYYFLSTQIEKNLKISLGAAQPNLSTEQILNILIPLPPLPIQQKIVKKLDTIFTELDKATAAAAANVKNAEALFQSYLIQVFERGGEGWVEIFTGDVCSSVTDGKHGDCVNQENSGYYFLSAKDVKNGALNYLGAREITKEDFEETHRRTNLESGDVLVTNSGTIGRMAIADDDDRTRKTTFQKSVAILKPKPNMIDSKFLFHLLTSKLIHFNNISAGTAQKNLLLRDIRSLKIKMPKELSKQKIISNQFDLIRQNINKLENIYKIKINEIIQLKQSILQQAFNGELVKAA